MCLSLCVCVCACVHSYFVFYFCKLIACNLNAWPTGKFTVFNVLRRLLIKTDTQTSVHKQMCRLTNTHTHARVNILESAWAVLVWWAQLRTTLLLSAALHLTLPLSLSPSLGLCKCLRGNERSAVARVYRIKVKFKASRCALITHTLPHTHTHTLARRCCTCPCV